jgi:DNA-binding transcriptional MerR regulator
VKEVWIETPRVPLGMIADVVFFFRQAGALLPKSVQAFRTISEVADDLDIQKHVLRFWESKFAQLRPMKRGGGRRYYRPEDVDLLRGIHHLLRSQAYTIKGVQRILREQGPEFVKACWQGGARASPGRGGGGAEGEAGANALRKKRGAARAPLFEPAASAAVGVKPRGAVKVGAAGRLSPESLAAMQSVIEQLEGARAALAKTRPSAQSPVAPKALAKPALKPALKPVSRASAKRS